MSNYPAWWDTTLTIYNKYVDPDTRVVTWYRTVVENCFWKYDNTRYYSGQQQGFNSILSNTKFVTCRIPKDERYLDILDWIKSDDRANHFTLNNGDFIVQGEVDDAIDEYEKGSRATDVLAKYRQYNKACEIDIFTVDTGTCRCCEHYNIRGV